MLGKSESYANFYAQIDQDIIGDVKNNTVPFRIGLHWENRLYDQNEGKIKEQTVESNPADLTIGEPNTIGWIHLSWNLIKQNPKWNLPWSQKVYDKYLQIDNIFIAQDKLGD